MKSQYILIANWKMNLDIVASIKLAQRIKSHLKESQKRNAEIVVCPSFDSIVAVGDILAESGIGLGAQDVFWQEKGAYTGEISASMLKASGCTYVIVGHSERRRYLHETDEMINVKVKSAAAAGLIPILCVGETFEERSAGNTDLVVMRQVIEGLKGIMFGETNQVIVAYEPVWVIGTGQAVEPLIAEHAGQVIKRVLIDLFSTDTILGRTRIIYGGSVDATNIVEYVNRPPLCGALVGTASLSADSFIRLISQL